MNFASNKYQLITPEALTSTLESYQVLPQILRELIIDQAISNITKKDIEFYLQQWQDSQPGTSRNQFSQHELRLLKIQTFKHHTWARKVKTYFLEKKEYLDQVIYSMIRTQDIGLANELYFRLQESEQSFAELALTYSQGPEALTYGLIGPVELGQYHPTFAHVLATGSLGEITQPLELEGWFIILRIEQRIPAQLDQKNQQRLLDELFENWLQSEIVSLNRKDLAELIGEKLLSKVSVD